MTCVHYPRDSLTMTLRETSPVIPAEIDDDGNILYLGINGEVGPHRIATMVANFATDSDNKTETSDTLFVIGHGKVTVLGPKVFRAEAEI